MTTLHSPLQGASQLFQWYQRSQIDYGAQYLQLYISYNAWYREVTNSANDREALALLKKRFVIWDDYIQGRTLQQLKPYVKRLAELSHQKPLVATRLYWNGEFKDENDWRSLIEFWYQMRCLIVHGSEFQVKHAWLAYETLNVFMGEIIDRMRACFNDTDLKIMHTLSSVADESTSRSVRFKKLQHKLYQKYIASPDVWQVDMQRVGSIN